MDTIRSQVLTQFDQIMHTVRCLDLLKDLEDVGFVEFKARIQGRYDMQMHIENFPMLSGNPPWMPLVRAILGKECSLKYVRKVFKLTL